MNRVKHVAPSGEGCVECLAIGDTWVHLRWCFIDEIEVTLPP